MPEDGIQRSLNFEKALGTSAHSKVQMECEEYSGAAGICVKDPRSQKRDLGHLVVFSRRSFTYPVATVGSRVAFDSVQRPTYRRGLLNLHDECLSPW